MKGLKTAVKDRANAALDEFARQALTRSAIKGGLAGGASGSPLYALEGASEGFYEGALQGTLGGAVLGKKPEDRSQALHSATAGGIGGIGLGALKGLTGKGTFDSTGKEMARGSLAGALSGGVSGAIMGEDYNQDHVKKMKQDWRKLTNEGDQKGS